MFNDGSTVPGPGLDPASAAERALQGLGDPSVTSIQVVGKLTDFVPPSLEIHMGAGQVEDVRTVWLGDMLDGAVADLMRTDQAKTRT